MSFTNELARQAKSFLNCKETSKNRSVCVDAIHKEFAENWGGSAEAWCAKFVWVCVERTCKAYGVKNYISHTASTAAMLSSAKNSGLNVNRTPKPGAIMYTIKDGQGHVGIVIEVKSGSQFVTIDGNSSDMVRFNNRTLGSQHQFIHIEEKYSNAIAPTNIALTAVVLGTTAFFGYKYFRKRK